MASRKRTGGKQTGPPPPLFTDHELSDFLSRACHDLRAPVRAIRAHAELFLRDPVPTADLPQRLGFMVDGAKKIDVLVDAISSFAIALRIDAESFQSTPMNVMLRTVLAKLDEERRACGAEVTHGDLPRVWGNPDRLVELLQRLVRNALYRRGPASPRIHIAAEEEREIWRFGVSDNGPAMEAASLAPLDDIFKPFARVHAGAHAATGLDLAICRAIVERHGGSIWAESKPGAGTTFFFTLPVA
jgi:chemotaxis family two-component system sensor kinase Cph1